MKNLTAITLACFSQTLISAPSNQDEQYNEFAAVLTQINSSSPLESASSHGISGYSFGLGYSQITLHSNNSYISGILGKEYAEKNEKAVPKIWITKGLFWPVDVGGFLTIISESGNISYGGYLQWTFFQEFALPALAFRYAYSKISGIKFTEFESNSFSLVGSWGYQFVTIFASLDYIKHNVEITNPIENQLIFDTEILGRKENFTTPNQNQIGIQIAPFSPLTKFTFASTSLENSKRYYTLKLSVGM